MLSPEKIRATTGGIVTPPTFFKTALSLAPHHVLASLVKGRWLDGKAQTVASLRLLAIYPPFLFAKLFCRQDGGIATPPLAHTNPPKTVLSLSLFVGRASVCACTASYLHYSSRFPYGERLRVLVWFRIRTITLAFRRGVGLPLPLHRTSLSPQPLQKNNNPSLSTTSLPPLSKGGGLTARHKLLLHCVCLQYIRLFYSPNFSAVKTEGLPHHQPFQTRTIQPTFRRARVCVLVWLRICTIPLAFRNANIYMCLFAFTSALSLAQHHVLASPRKRVRFCCSVKPSQLWWGLLPIRTINEIFRTIPRKSLSPLPLNERSVGFVSALSLAQHHVLAFK